MLFGSAVDDLVRRSGDIDLYVIRGDAETRREVRPASAEPSRRNADVPGYVAAVLLTGVVTAVGWPLHHRFGIENENILMLYLLGVLWVATRHARGAAVLASVLAV